jgi:hypothetical protein
MLIRGIVVFSVIHFGLRQENSPVLFGLSRELYYIIYLYASERDGTGVEIVV